jgi:hypothetical protein
MEMTTINGWGRDVSVPAAGGLAVVVAVVLSGPDRAPLETPRVALFDALFDTTRDAPAARAFAGCFFGGTFGAVDDCFPGMEYSEHHAEARPPREPMAESPRKVP